LFLHVFMVMNLIVHGFWILLSHRRSLIPLIASGIMAAIIAFPVTLEWTERFQRQGSKTDVLLEDAPNGGPARTKQRIKVGWEGMPYVFYTRIGIINACFPPC
jgi:hypothetical protein